MTRSLVELRKIELDDWRAVHSWARLPEACRFQPWGPNTRDQTRAFVQTAVQAWAQDPQRRFAYAVCSRGEPVGMGELRVGDARHRQGEIAYIVHPRLWGQGIGTAVGRELLRIGFSRLNLHRIHGSCDPRNLASARVLRKLGMAHEGGHRHTALIRDGWRDSDVFSILGDEWPDRSAFQ